MPTYEYECTRCSHVFEEFKPISAPRRQRCPRCRGKVQLLISGGTGVLFKGSGFYVNDSRPQNRGADRTPSPAEADAGQTADSPPAEPKGNDSSKAEKNKAQGG